MQKYLSFILILILFVACDSTNDFGTPFTKGQEVSLTAAIGEQRPQMLPGKQRVSGEDSGTEINLKWDEGDQIKVIVGDKSAIFTLTSGAGSSDGTFTGIMPADGTNFRVEYPISEPDISTQTYIENGFSNGLMKMVAENGTIDGGFILKAQYALLGLQLIGNQTLGKIILTDLSGEQTYTLNCENVTLKDDEATIFYIVVPVEGWENGMLVEVYDKDGVVILRKEKKGKIDFKTTEAMIMPTLEARGPGKRIGVFSVDEGKYVSFSQGNLQYIQSTKTWQFADHQWEYIGNNHYRNGQLSDTIEYFGWSGKNSKAPWGISLSTELTDYTGEFLDWGTNIIAGDLANTWRTLSNDEWNYICQGRKNAANLLGFGKIDTISGLIILPDDWVAPDGITFTPNIDNPNSNPYNLQQWTAMENAGAVFIPPTGYFNHKMDNMRTVHQYGYYRTSTLAQDGRQIFSIFSIIEDGLPNGLSGWIVYSYSGHNQGNLFYAYPVRLVHDTIPKN